MFQLSYNTEFKQFRKEKFCPQKGLSSIRVCARVWLFRCSFVFESSTWVERARQPWDLRHLLESERYFSFVSFQLRLMATWHFSFKRRKCFTLWAITRKIELSLFFPLTQNYVDILKHYSLRGKIVFFFYLSYKTGRQT